MRVNCERGKPEEIGPQDSQNARGTTDREMGSDSGNCGAERTHAGDPSLLRDAKDRERCIVHISNLSEAEFTGSRYKRTQRGAPDHVVRTTKAANGSAIVSMRKDTMRRLEIWFLKLMIALLTVGVISCSKDNDSFEMKEQQRELRSQVDSAIAAVDREVGRVMDDLQTVNDSTRSELNREMHRLRSVRDPLVTAADKISDVTANNRNEFVAMVNWSLEEARETLKDIRDQVALRQQNGRLGNHQQESESLL
jgi:hypothetical protein